jgi:hypothetical protein
LPPSVKLLASPSRATADTLVACEPAGCSRRSAKIPRTIVVDRRDAGAELAADLNKIIGTSLKNSQ